MCLGRTCHLIVSTEIALNGTTSLQITIPATTFNNGETFGLYLAQAIPSTGTPLPVGCYPLWSRCRSMWSDTC